MVAARGRAFGWIGARMTKTKYWGLWTTLLTIVLSVASDAGAASNTFVLQSSFPGANSAFLGYSVAIDGTTAVVGAPNDNATLGAAYVYVQTGSTWTQQQALTASDGAPNDQFGYQVAISGGTVLVGAPGRANDQGYVYVFTRSGTAWTQATEFTSGDGAADDCFGCSIALRGGTALVGAPGKASNTGSAYVFTGSGATWQQGQEFLGTTGEYFGFSVALSSAGTTGIVGAFAAANATGQAYVFASNAGVWSQQAVLTASDGQPGDSFGTSVAVDGSTALVGAYAASGNRGEVYVFTSSAGTWTQQPKLLASDGAQNDYFGYAVALSGSTAIVGAYEKNNTSGAAYVFTSSGAVWSQQQEMPAPGPGQSFAYSVGVSGSAAVIGAFSTSNDAGAALLFGTTVPSAPALGSMGGLLLSIAFLLAAMGSMRGRAAGAMRVLGASGGSALAAALFFTVGVGATGCSLGTDRSSGPAADPTPGSSTASGAAAGQDTGSVGFQLTLPGGDQIASINWDITGPNGATTVVQSGSVTVQALGAQFMVGSIPTGSNYRVTLSGVSPDAGIECSGSATFDVATHAVTHVAVQLDCSSSGTGGHGTNVNGMLFNCAAWSTVTASPLETTVGSSVSVAATGTGPDPTLLSFAWSAPSGSFSAPDGAASNFTCTQVGPVVVTVTVGDGPIPDGSTCNPAQNTNSFTVMCDPGTSDGGRPDAGSDGGPPLPAPAIPPLGLGVLAAAIAAIGAAAQRRGVGANGRFSGSP